MPIRPLPPLLVNQIAAGEVIERPASVVKELLENAIDAGAQRVTVEIESGGTKLIRITDDGRGIPSDELPLAVAPHATSKISAAEDLDAIATMGFRGEALASITAVSRLSIVSRPPDDAAAAQLDAEGDRVDAVRPAGAPAGTTITVRNLFFNTPARRKFLKTDATESNRIVETVRTLAMPLPEIGFTLIVDGRTRFELPPVRSPRERILAILGPETAPELLDVSEAIPGFRLTGLVGRPSIARGTARSLRLYLNGRAISDRAVTHAVREAYRGLIEPAAYPTAVLFLEMNPAAVDVNVHPAKAEVRFRESSTVHRLVQRGVGRALQAADLVPDFSLARSTAGVGPVPSRPFMATGASDQAIGGAVVFDAVDQMSPREKGLVYRELKAALAREAPQELTEDAAAPIPVRAAVGALQVHKTYIVTEDEDGLVIVDQHALHERIMFERLLARIDQDTLESQRLLVPAVVEVDERMIDAASDLAPLFERLGIEAEPMGPRAVAVHAFPSLLFERGADPVSFVEDVLTRAADGALGDGLEGALHEILDMMACKAAIKAGDALEPKAMSDLLAQRSAVERSTRCPHGRPTTLRLSLADIERQFGRR